jgi:cell division protein FtsB
LSIQDLQAEIIAIDQEIAQLENSVSLALVKKLLNLIERVVKENNTLLTERQQLRDEINRLKGEQGKPDIKANKKNDGDISSEAERKEAEANANKDNNESGENSEGKKKRQREPKLPKIKINREQICLLDKVGLPDDLVFKDYEDVVIQDLIINQ